MSGDLSKVLICSIVIPKTIKRRLNGSAKNIHLCELRMTVVCDEKFDFLWNWKNVKLNFLEKSNSLMRLTVKFH